MNNIKAKYSDNSPMTVEMELTPELFKLFSSKWDMEMLRADKETLGNGSISIKAEFSGESKEEFMIFFKSLASMPEMNLKVMGQNINKN